MTFTEILDAYKNHKYIRRQAWSDNIYMQLMESTDDQLTRMVMINDEVTVLDGDARFTSQDLISDDWEEIDCNTEKLSFGNNLLTKHQLLTLKYMKDVQDAFNSAPIEEQIEFRKRNPQYFE